MQIKSRNDIKPQPMGLRTLKTPSKTIKEALN